MVSAIVEARRKVGNRHGFGDAGVTARPSGLRQRLVGGVSNGVAAKLPSPAAKFEKSEVVELAHVCGLEALSELFGEGLERGDRTGRSQDRGVLDDPPLRR